MECQKKKIYWCEYPQLYPIRREDLLRLLLERIQLRPEVNEAIIYQITHQLHFINVYSYHHNNVKHYLRQVLFILFIKIPTTPHSNVQHHRNMLYWCEYPQLYPFYLPVNAGHWNWSSLWTSKLYILFLFSLSMVCLHERDL